MFRFSNLGRQACSLEHIDLESKTSAENVRNQNQCLKELPFIYLQAGGGEKGKRILRNVAIPS